MEEAIRKELEDLRAENKILRDSLTEVREEEEANGCLVRRLGRYLAQKSQSRFEEMKNQVEPCKEKMAENLKDQLVKNPVPFLAIAFGIGFVISRKLR